MKLAPDLARKRTAFVQRYKEENKEQLTRGQARMRFQPIPILGADDEVVIGENGKPVLMDSPVDRLTEQDWQAMGNVLTLYPNPSDTEIGLEILDDVLDRAYEPFVQIIGLVLAKNDAVLKHKRDQDLPAWLMEQGEDTLAAADLGELIELTVTAVEVANTQVRDKLAQLGDRWGNVAGTFGIKVRSSVQASATTSTSSTDSNSTSSTGSLPSTIGPNGTHSEPVGAPS
jgi:hypothetical protein